MGILDNRLFDECFLNGIESRAVNVLGLGWSVRSDSSRWGSRSEIGKVLFVQVSLALLGPPVDLFLDGSRQLLLLRQVIITFSMSVDQIGVHELISLLFVIAREFLFGHLDSPSLRAKPT